MTDKIRFSLPIHRNGTTVDFIAYPSARRKHSFVVAETAHCRRPAMSVFTPESRFARHTYPNFIAVTLEALYDDDEDLTVLAVDATVSWRGIEKYKVRCSIMDCNSEIIYDRWSKQHG